MQALSVLVVFLVLASPPAQADLDAAWKARGDAAGLTRAVAVYESAAQAPDAGLQVFERLAHLRFLEADALPEKSDARVEQYRRCVAEGLRGLSRLGAADGIALELPDFAALHDAREKIGKAAAGLFFGTATCYGPTIPTFSLFKQASAAKRFKRILERAVELDPTVLQGGPRRSLALYLLQAPAIMGGDDGEARVQAEAAMRVNPRFAFNLVVRALVVGCAARAPGCMTDLRAAAALPEDAVPELVPEQRQGQAQAREELKRRSER